MTKCIIVLSDGETWTDIDGCTLRQVEEYPEHDHEVREAKIIGYLVADYNNFGDVVGVTLSPD